MKWTETSIARALAYQTFNRKSLVVVPNCGWTGYECDLLVVNPDLRIIDVEIKISRADLKADAKKDKWWETYMRDPVTNRYERLDSPRRREHPPKVWKHYYVLPAEIWTDELFEAIPPSSGVLLLKYQGSLLCVMCWRRPKPNKDAEKISPAAAIDIARLASLRMWETYKALEKTA